MADYTKGEWKVRQWFGTSGAEGFTLYIEEDGQKLALARDIVNAANAYLIASAPDLYEACKDALNYFNNEIVTEFMKSKTVPYFKELPVLIRAIAKVESLP